MGNPHRHHRLVGGPARRPAASSSRPRPSPGSTSRSPSPARTRSTRRAFLGVMALGAKYGEEVVLTAAATAPTRRSTRWSRSSRATSTRSNEHGRVGDPARDTARHRGQPRDGLRTGGAGRATGPAAGGEGAVDDEEAALADVRGPSSRSPSRSRCGRRGSTTRPSRSSRRPPSSRATRASSRPRQGARGRPRAGTHAIANAVETYAPSSRRSAATSPSGWPTCVTSGHARSPRCSGSRPPACPPSPSRASSSREDLAPAETATSTGASSSASSPRPAAARATRRSSPRRWDPRRRAARGRHRDPARHARRPRRGHRRGDDRPRHGARHRPAGAGRPSRAEALSHLSGPADLRRCRDRAARQHRRGRRRRRRGAQDLEGVGLFRTEFVYLSATKAPTVEEQSRSTAASSRPSRGAAWSCAPSTPEPTSR